MDSEFCALCVKLYVVLRTVYKIRIPSLYLTNIYLKKKAHPNCTTHSRDNLRSDRKRKYFCSVRFE